MESTEVGKILFKIGPIGVANSPDIIQTYRVLPNGESQIFKRLWGRFMLHSRSAGLKMGKATMADIAAIRTLIDEGLEQLDQFREDEISAEELIDQFDVLLDAAERARGRVLFGFETILENEILDPGKNYLELHPKIREGLYLRWLFGWLIWLMNAIKLRPWNW